MYSESDKDVLRQTGMNILRPLMEPTKKPASKSEAIKQEEVRKAIFRMGLVGITGASRLEEWKAWDFFDLEDIAYKTPGVALDYVEHARQGSCERCTNNCRDPYVNLLQELSERQLSRLEEFLLPYATENLIKH